MKRSHVLFVGKLQKLRNFDTKRRTLGEPFDFAQTYRRTSVIEVNHWAKVANKTANINVQHRKYQKGDIAQQCIDTYAMSCCVISHFLIFAVFDV